MQFEVVELIFKNFFQIPQIKSCVINLRISIIVSLYWQNF